MDQVAALQPVVPFFNVIFVDVVPYQGLLTNMMMHKNLIRNFFFPLKRRFALSIGKFVNNKWCLLDFYDIIVIDDYDIKIHIFIK